MSTYAYGCARKTLDQILVIWNQCVIQTLYRQFNLWELSQSPWRNIKKFDELQEGKILPLNAHVESTQTHTHTYIHTCLNVNICNIYLYLYCPRLFIFFHSLKHAINLSPDTPLNYSSNTQKGLLPRCFYP